MGILVISGTLIYPQNSFDMKYAEYGIPIITLVSAIIIILIIKKLSILFSGVPVLCSILSKLGNASLVIMFIHLPLKYFIEKYVYINPSIMFVGLSIISYLFYVIFSKNIYTRVLFLGSRKDFDIIYNKFTIKKNNKQDISKP